jgi:hypothetical protein
MVWSVLLMPAPADAQGVRIARPRAAVVVRPPVVVRPRTTVFIGGYYYPSFYRASLFYRPYGGRYYGASSYQWPPYGYGRYDLSGSVRLQVAPRETEVFVDGYYAGTVDDFDGIFQRLHLEAREHDLELYLAGHRPFHQRIYVQPDRTFQIRHTMEPLGPGEAAPPRPAGAPAPAAARDPGLGTRGPGPGPRPIEPVAPGAASSNFGELALRVQPGDADVLIDGERWEGGLENERLVVQLGAGVHSLEIRKEGYRSYFTDVTIRSGDTRTLNVALTRQ